MKQNGVLHGPARRFQPWFELPKAVRDLCGLPAVLGRAGSLELRLALTKKEIRRSQRLRFSVFHQEGGATADIAAALSRRDKCPFDRVCDHLFVVDTRLSDEGELRRTVVGTTRMLRSDVASRCGGFYSATEFDLAPLLRRHDTKRFLELGRSCVHAEYRSKHVIDLLWQGIGTYAAHHDIDVLMGCSSLPGTDPERLALQLGFAYHYAAAPPVWSVAPWPHLGAAVHRLDKSEIDPRVALASLPPLMKAYVRGGASFSTGAAVDRKFGTTDLFTILPLAEARPRLLAHFGRGVARANA